MLKKGIGEKHTIIFIMAASMQMKTKEKSHEEFNN